MELWRDYAEFSVCAKATSFRNNYASIIRRSYFLWKSVEVTSRANWFPKDSFLSYSYQFRIRERQKSRKFQAYYLAVRASYAVDYFSDKPVDRSPNKLQPKKPSKLRHFRSNLGVSVSEGLPFGRNFSSVNRKSSR